MTIDADLDDMTHEELAAFARKLGDWRGDVTAIRAQAAALQAAVDAEEDSREIAAVLIQMIRDL